MTSLGPTNPNNPLSTNTTTDTEQQQPESRRVWLGRIVQSSANNFFANVIGPIEGVQQLIKLISAIVLLKIGPKGAPGMTKHLTSLDGIGDGVATAADLQKMARGQFFEGSIYNIGANIVLFLADVAGTLMLLEEFGVFSLANIAAGIGNTKVFGFKPFAFITKLSIGALSVRLVTIGFAFFAIDAEEKIRNGADNSYKNYLSCVSSTTEVVVKCLGFLGASTMTLGVGALTAALLSISYRSFPDLTPRKV